MSTITAKKSAGFRLSSNPVLKRLSKVSDRSTSDCATYGGIFAKTAYFLLITIAGIVAYFMLNAIVFTNPAVPGVELHLEGDTVKQTAVVEQADTAAEQGAVTDASTVTTVPDETSRFADGKKLSSVRFAVVEIVIAIVCALFTFIMPFVCAFSVSATPVCGTLYCASEGYLLSMILFKFLAMRNIDASIGLVALVLTVMVVAAMALLYVKRIVKVDRKFMTVLMSAVFALLLGGVVTALLCLIPTVRDTVAGFMKNPVIGIACSALSVLLASMFLLSDFAVIENSVENKLPAKY